MTRETKISKIRDLLSKRPEFKIEDGNGFISYKYAEMGYEKDGFYFTAYRATDETNYKVKNSYVDDLVWVNRHDIVRQLGFKNITEMIKKES